MPPRLVSRQALRAISNASRSSRQLVLLSSRQSVRYNSSTNNNNKMPKQETPGSAPNKETLDHVSEGAAKMAAIMGEETAPDLSVGTPVAEVLARKSETKDKAPEVLKDAVKNAANDKKPSGARSYSTMVQRQLPNDPEGKFLREIDAETEYITAAGAEYAQMQPQDESTTSQNNTHIWQGKEEPRTKFGMPDETKITAMRKRYDDIVSQMASIMTKEGQKSKAESNVIRILNNLKTSRPPVINPARPLLPGAPPASHLPLNPVLYLTLAIDSIAPLVKIKSIKGAAGGGRALLVPQPLPLKARRRAAIGWILDAAVKKPFRGSGRGGLAQRISDEIVAIIEGKSGVWQKRTELHKQGVMARSNLKPRMRRK